jgi:hypothetical protein
MCQAHLTHSLRYGHPEQARIEKGRILEPWLRRAKAFCKAHRHDEPVLHALEVMRELLLPNELPSKWLSGRPKRGQGNNPAYFIALELQRLADGDYKPARIGKGGTTMAGQYIPREKRPGVTAEEALLQLTAMWLLYEHDPGNFKDGGGRTLNHAISRAIFALRTPRQTWSRGKAHSRDFSSLALNIYGQRLRDRLAPFLVNMTAAVKQQMAAEVERVEKMRKPFAIPPSPTPPSPTPREKGTPLDESSRRSFVDFLTSYRP